MSGVVVKVTENKLIVTKEDKKVRITAPYVDNHYDATFASDAETLAGTETTKAISPASLEAVKDVEGGFASKAYADGKVSQTITEDVEDKAPSEGTVFDALALKAPLASPTFTGDVVVPDQTAGNNSTKAANTKYVDAKVADAINDGVTGIAPSQNAVFDALALKADADAVINALASAVDENIPIFDGITGDKLKDSGVKLSDKADTSAVTAGLLLKADITSLEIEKKLLMDEIDSLKKSAIENSNAPYLTVSDYGDVALAKNSVGVGTVGIDGVTVKQLISNGNFATYSPWVVPSSWEYVSVSDNVLTIKVKTLGSGANGMVYQNTVQLPIVGHKYFITVDTYAPYTNAIRFIYGGYDNSTNIIPTANAWKTSAFIFTATTTGKTVSFLCNTLVNYSIGDEFKFRNIMMIDLTAHGLASLTKAQLAKLLPVYFDGKKTSGGVGCLVSKDSAEDETCRMYFSTDPMYSNATAKDTLTYSGGKYYHTHNVDSDGVAIETPYDTEVETNGQFLALSEGTVTYEPWYPDIAVYTDKFTLDKAITAVKELYKYGSATPITDAVIAEDGLSFTSASLTAGDLAYGVFEFDEPLRPLMTIKSRNDNATIADTANGKVYTFRPVITNGAIASWAVTEV